MSEKGVRYFGLDLFRSFAMVMGLLIHAPLVFLIPAVVGEENLGFQSLILDLLISWIHIWRMPAFFLLSGFFTQLIIEKKGAPYFFHDRFTRVFLAMITFMLVQNWLWNETLLTLGHLWFLYYLMVISTLHLILSSVITENKIWFFKLSGTRKSINFLGWLTFFGLLILFTGFARESGIRLVIPKELGDLQFASLPYFWLWFSVGVIIFRTSNFLEYIETKNPLLMLCIGGISFHILLLLAHEAIFFTKLFVNFFSASSTICWTFFLLALTQKLVKGPSKLLDLFVELSYPIYLVHVMPAIFFGAILFLEFDFNAMQMFVPNIFLIGCSSIIIYYLFIKFTPVNWIVNGYRKSWFKPF